MLTYLRRILESLDHPDMINLILHYLLALPDAISPNKKPSRSSVSEARKRKSMDLTKMMAARAEEPATPLLFNLVDLILSCLRSRNQQTIHVTLQLVSAILKRHHRYAVFTLLRTDLLPSDATHRTAGAHEQEVDYLVSLAGAIGGKTNFDDAYANILKDTMARVESHPCSFRMMIPRVSTNGVKLPNPPPEKNMPGAPREVREHTLRPDDPLLNVILDLLETFFLNSVETNLSVSETIVDLAICGYMNVEGWLSRDPATYSYTETEDEEDLDEHDYETSVASEVAEPAPQTDDSTFSEKTFDEAQRLRSIRRCRSKPEWTESQLPRILQVLKRLGDQVASYKRTIPRFNDLLEQRRDAFQTAESMLDGPSPTPLPPPPPPKMRRVMSSGPGTPERLHMDDAFRAASPPRPSALEGFAQRLLSELGTTAPSSRSVSPKHRQEHVRIPGTLSTPGSYPGGPEPMTPNAFRVPPKEWPLSYGGGETLDAVRRGNVRSFSSGGVTAASIGPSFEERDMVAESQASAFAAFDQSILSRRVGLPDESLKPIPLDLTRKPEGGDVGQDQGQDGEDGRGQEHDEEQEQEKEQAEEQAEEQAQESAQQPDQDKRGDDGDDARSDTPAPTDPRKAHEGTVSVSHLLTNIIIFQSFLLELASLMQVRASLFSEVRYA